MTIENSDNHKQIEKLKKDNKDTDKRQKQITSDY